MFEEYMLKDTFLFYAHDKKKKEKWSIGMKSGKVSDTVNDGGFTVDKNNKAFTAVKQKQVFGPEYEKIISSLKKHSAKYNHEHPGIDLLINGKKYSDKEFAGMIVYAYESGMSKNTKEKIRKRIRKIIKKDDLEALYDILGEIPIDDDMLDSILRNSKHTKLQEIAAAIMVAENIKMDSKRIENLYSRFKESKFFLSQIVRNLKAPLKIIRDILITGSDTYAVHNAAANIVKRSDITKKDLLYIINTSKDDNLVDSAQKRLEKLNQS